MKGVDSGLLTAAPSQSTNRQIIRALVSLISAALLLRLGGLVNQVAEIASHGGLLEGVGEGGWGLWSKEWSARRTASLHPRQYPPVTM